MIKEFQLFENLQQTEKFMSDKFFSLFNGIDFLIK